MNFEKYKLGEDDLRSMKTKDLDKFLTRLEGIVNRIREERDLRELLHIKSIDPEKWAYHSDNISRTYIKKLCHKRQNIFS